MRRGIYRGALGGMARRQEREPMAPVAPRSRVSDLWRSRSQRSRYDARAARDQADMEHQDGNRLAHPRPRRKHTRLGDNERLPRRRQPGALERPYRKPTTEERRRGEG